MKNRIWRLIFIIFISSNSYAQFTEKHNFIYANVSFDLFTIKIDSEVIKNWKIINNTGHLNEEDYFTSLNSEAPFFAITASIVDSLCKPLGLYISQGNKSGEININQGVGNFYLNPNGFIASDSTHFLINDSKNYVSSSNYNNAIQSGPMLISSGVINSNFDKSSRNKKIRCGVGYYSVNNNNFLVFAKSNSPISFYDFANLFLIKYKCNNALNLESAALCSIHLPNQKIKYRSDIDICNYLFFKL